jgi:hypothetical protein
VASVILGVAYLIMLFANVWPLNSETQQCPWQFPKIFSCVLGTNLAGGVLGAGGALSAAWIAWMAVQRQIEEQQRQARAVERAYVYGGANYLRGILEIMIKVNNHGKTPAFVGTVTATICNDAKLNQPIVWQKEEWKGWTLPAPTLDATTDVTLPFVCYDDVIVGRIWYRDIFNQCHSSGFVLRLALDGLPGVKGHPELWEDRNEQDLRPAESKST